MGIRVHRYQACISARKMDCSTCPRAIGMGMNYLRVMILEPDEDGVLIEIKRLTLCVWCSTAYKKDHP